VARHRRIACSLEGTALDSEERELVDELLARGCAVLLVPVGDQVLVSVTDLEKLAGLIDPN